MNTRQSTTKIQWKHYVACSLSALLITVSADSLATTTTMTASTKSTSTTTTSPTTPPTTKSTTPPTKPTKGSDTKTNACQSGQVVDAAGVCTAIEGFIDNKTNTGINGLPATQ